MTARRPVGTPAPMPTSVRPMLAVLGELPRSDAGWSYEFKWDGVRAIVWVEAGSVRVASRNGNDITATLPGVGRIASELRGGKHLEAVLDGELVAFDSAGRPDFQLLQQRAVPASYVAFDLLHLNGRSLTDEPYSTRREALESLVPEHGAVVVLSPRFREHGADVLAVSRERGLEGVMAKRDDAPYRLGGRSPEWLKVKNFATQEVVIGGWTPGQGGRTNQIGSLLLGIPEGEGLRYVGQVGTGFSEKVLEELAGRLAPLTTDANPFTAGEIPSRYRRAANFVRPDLVGEVQFSEWTDLGRLRQPSWRGLREDKSPGEVRRES